MFRSEGGEASSPIPYVQACEPIVGSGISSQVSATTKLINIISAWTDSRFKCEIMLVDMNTHILAKADVVLRVRLVNAIEAMKTITRVELRKLKYIL